MAMTKKERAEFDAAILRAGILAALRWTDRVEADVPPPGFDEPNTSGWELIVGYDLDTCRVREAWSSSVSHGSRSRESGCASQGSISLYSTELLALKALRHKVEQKSAERLYRLDTLIAKAAADPDIK
jgi:hypothetical protein